MNVSYDGRALLLNGHRSVLISGSIYYPRSTPEVCNVLGFIFVIIKVLLLTIHLILVVCCSTDVAGSYC